MTPKPREGRHSFTARYLASHHERGLAPAARVQKAHELFDAGRTAKAEAVGGEHACSCGGSCKGCRSRAEAKAREAAPPQTQKAQPSGLNMSAKFRSVMSRFAAGELTAGGKVVKDRGEALRLAQAEGKAARAAHRLLHAGVTRKSMTPEDAEDLRARIEAASHVTNPDPSERERSSGRYRKGKVDVQGLPVVIEIPRGGIRRGKDSEGKPWWRQLAHHYGYIARTESEADGDPVDVFVGPQPHLDTVYIVDQLKADGRTFDEHKVMLGFPGELAAREGYLGNYKLGWRGLGAITPMAMEEFKQWLKEDTGRPVSPRLRLVQPWSLEEGMSRKSCEPVPNMAPEVYTDDDREGGKQPAKADWRERWPLRRKSAGGAAGGGPAPAAAMSSVNQAHGGAMRGFPAMNTRKHIVKLSSGKYRLYSRKKGPDGKAKNLGTFDSYSAALKHERAVEYFKHAGKSGTGGATTRKSASAKCEMGGWRERWGLDRKCMEGENAGMPGPCPTNGGQAGAGSKPTKKPILSPELQARLERERAKRDAPRSSQKPAPPAAKPKAPRTPHTEPPSAATAPLASPQDAEWAIGRASRIDDPTVGGLPFASIQVLFRQLRHKAPEMTEGQFAGLLEHLARDYPRGESGIEFHYVNGLERTDEEEHGGFFHRVAPKEKPDDPMGFAAFMVKDMGKLVRNVSDYFSRGSGEGAAKSSPALTRKSATCSPLERPHPCSACCPCARCRSAVCVVAYPIGALTTKDAVRDLPQRTGLVHINRRADVQTDDDRKSASCILATSSRDRQGDVIECGGVLFDDHRANPVVLYDHGKMDSRPIGKCEDPDERYTVRYLPDEDIIVQTTWFASTPFADQVYGLIRGGFLRANSIAVKDLEVEPLPPDPARGHFTRRDDKGNKIPFKHILKSALAEVTWTSLPANPEAVRSLLDGGRIDVGGYNLVEIDGIVRKSLEMHLPARKTWAQGSGLTMKSMTAQTKKCGIDNWRERWPLRRKCMVGENAGMPGPCPEGQEGGQSPGEDRGQKERAMDESAASAQESNEHRHTQDIDARELEMTEPGREGLAGVARAFPKSEGYLPIVYAIDKDGRKKVIDGNHRTRLARRRGDKIPAVGVDRKEWSLLRRRGFGRMEIAFAALVAAGETDAASALDNGLGGVVAHKGYQAASLLEEYRQRRDERAD